MSTPDDHRTVPRDNDAPTKIRPVLPPPMTTANQNAEAPKGYEILTPEFRRAYGVPETAKFKLAGNDWFPWHPDFRVKPEEENVIQFIAPLGTMAMVSTPLASMGCECKMRPAHEANCQCQDCWNWANKPHLEDCPSHPRNARVKVLPGLLAELKEKPEGLECCAMPGTWPPNAQWGVIEPADWPIRDHPDDIPSHHFAYSLPRYVYDAIEEGKKVSIEKGGEVKCNAPVTTEAAPSLDISAAQSILCTSNAPAEEVQSLPGAGPECFGGEDFPEPKPAPASREWLEKAAARENATPTYRPLAPDEVPQAGEKCPRCLNGPTYHNCNHPFHIRAPFKNEPIQWTRTVVDEPAPVAGTPLNPPETRLDKLQGKWRVEAIYVHQQIAEACAEIRSLESKLAVANAEILRLTRNSQPNEKAPCGHLNRYWRGGVLDEPACMACALAELRAERDALRKALDGLLSCVDEWEENGFIVLRDKHDPADTEPSLVSVARKLLTKEAK